jgi:SAM-dependent methyltransferase
VLSRNARLRWDAAERLVVEGARSTEGLAIERDDVALLDAFATPADPESVVGLGAKRTLIDDLIRVGVLVPAGGGTVGAGHFADPQRQLAMLWDSLRMDAYRRALERCATGNVLVELGCGHGVLACLAARAGARRVYAIEETSMIEVAREIARVNGVEDRIVFVEGNSLDVELPEPADVVYADLMGPDPLGAGMLVYMHDAAVRLLKDGGVLLPARLTMLAVGVDSSRIARETDAARGWLRDAAELSATYGLDLSPLEEASRAAFDRAYDEFSYKEFLDPGDPPAGADRILTRETRVAEFEVGSADPARAVEAVLPLHVESGGMLDAMATYAAVQLDGETTLTTSPYAPERPSAWGGQFLSTLAPLEVAVETTVEVEAEVTPWTSPAVHYRHRPGPASARAGAPFDR